MNLIIMSWIATIYSIVGNIGVIYRKLWGMWVWTIGSSIWIIYSILRKDYAQLVMFLIYTLLNLWGIVQWSKYNKGVSNE